MTTVKFACHKDNEVPGRPFSLRDRRPYCRLHGNKFEAIPAATHRAGRHKTRRKK